MSAYNTLILDATRCPAEDAPRIEVLMRWWFATLDAIATQELQESAVAQYEVLQVYREEAKLDDVHGRVARQDLEQIELEARGCVR